MHLDINLNSILERGAKVYPSKIAIENLSGDKISYKELNDDSENIKKVLSEYAIGAGSRIGILCAKNSKVVSFIFAVLKTQAAYVPLDIKAPFSRNNFICDNCELQAVFLEKEKIKDFVVGVNINDSYTEHDINETYSLLVFDNRKPIHNDPLAYIIYTSGSTGTPKGVKHTHKSALTFINWTITLTDINRSKRLFSFAPFHFDLSILDIFTCFSIGATLILTDEKTVSNPLLFAQHLSQKRADIIYATPSALSYLVTFGKMERHSYENLHTVLFAGEVFPISQLKLLKEKLPDTEFYNLYGPTETNVCTWFKIPHIISEVQKEPYPIGKTCEYAKYRILKIENDIKGELLISGDSLMNGYWNDSKKTNSSIEIDIDGITWYHTGDIVTLNNSNDLIYLGRKDRMVKRNGYRIELNEIENAIALYKKIVEVAVTAQSVNSQTDTIITAHLVYIENDEKSALDMINYCNSALPTYMMPNAFKFYHKLPKTSTNKIDYKQLQSQYND